MKNALFAIGLAALTLAGCKSHTAGAPAINQDAIRALGGTVPNSSYGQAYWLKQRDANTPEWQQAKRLCEQTVLANYPNCMPVTDIVQAEQKKKAEAGNRAVTKNDEMFRRGYQYDFVRKSWLPFRRMMSAGCVSAPAYPNDRRRIGFSTWKCPKGTPIPKGISDPQFSEEEEHATN